MSTQAQIKANRLNAQKSTGPNTAEGKTVVAQNAIKHGLFAQQNVINCENHADFDQFHADLRSGLEPAGGVEEMLAERIVSLAWRLERVERIQSEAIDVMIAKIETDSLEGNRRERAGLLDEDSGRSELALGWAMIEDFKYSHVLERLLMYEKRIESSLYKAMAELKKLQRMRESERADANSTIPSLSEEAATHRGQDARETQGRDALATARETQGRDALVAETIRSECAKQSQCVMSPIGVKPFGEKDYGNKPCSGIRENRFEQSQFHTAALPKDVGQREETTSRASDECF
ncbi:MAG: hypothetical protein A2Z25_06035 [Planctomycetes bacterium RBG_16_55_9]|nr:MAG: hypothetical protein A2Z25_06035 [Planctomycetes bacterium RBG_16_55_9]